MAVEPVGSVTTTEAADPAQGGASTELQQAFAQGVVKFMGVMLQSAQADIIEAINDTTSTPDAPN